MHFRIMPLEERIVLDAAGVLDVLGAFHLDSGDGHHTDTVKAIPAVQTISIDANAASTISGIHVLVISTAITDPSVLAAAAKDPAHVVLYDPSHTTLQQLADKIEAVLHGQQADSIAFANEGTPGQFSLTQDVVVNNATLHASVALQTFWHEVGAMTKEGGRIDLLACDVAAGTGIAVVNDITHLVDSTGKDVQIAASTDLTGNPADGGNNWLLAVGNINVAPIYFNLNAVSHWDSVLGAAPVAFNIPLPSGAQVDTNFPMANVNGIVYFVATDPTHGMQLWKTDGNLNGASIVSNFSSGTTIGDLTAFNGALYFSIDTSAGTGQLFETNGTAVTPIGSVFNSIGATDPGGGPNQSLPFFTDNGLLYFVGNTTVLAAQVYISDGTTAGTSLLMDIPGGTIAKNFTGIDPSGTPLVVFSATDSVNGSQLWVTNGMPETGNPVTMNPSTNTYMLTDLNVSNGGISPGSSSFSNPLENDIVAASDGSAAFFSANLGTSGSPFINLWATNGTIAGTIMVSDLNFPGSSTGSSPIALNSMIELNGAGLGVGIPGVIFGITYSPGSNMIVIASDDIGGATPITSPANLTFNDAVAFNNLIYFSGTEGINAGLWTTDGTLSPTATNEFASFGFTAPSNLTVFNNTLVFSVGTELQQTDGTTITLITNISPGSTPDNFVSNGQALMLSVPSTGDLWTTGNPIQLTDQSYTFSSSTFINAINGVLNGATDLNNQTFNVISNTNPSHGVIDPVNSDGSFTYTPNPGYTGPDSFSFQTTDAQGFVRTGFTLIDVTGNSPPPPPPPPPPPAPTEIHSPTSSYIPTSSDTDTGSTESTTSSSSGTESSSTTTTTTTANAPLSAHTTTATPVSAPASVIPLIQGPEGGAYHEQGVSFHNFSHEEGTVDSAMNAVSDESAALTFLNHEAFSSAANAIYYAAHHKTDTASEEGVSLEDTLSMVDFLPDTKTMSPTEKSLYLYGQVGLSLLVLKIANTMYHTAVKTGIQRITRTLSLKWLTKRFSLNR